MTVERDAGGGESNGRADGDESLGSVRVASLRGPALTAALPHLAALRIQVFREYPYLYDGDLDYERKYLSSYATDPSAVVVGAFDGDRLIGAATGASLAGEKGAWTAPFVARGVPLDQVFYFGESVLRPEYRGQGLGHRFFDHREKAAERQGARLCAFVAVIRPEDHPARPADYRPLDPFWRRRGYAPLADAVAEFEWREVGADIETKHQLQYWTRALRA